jgi:hypothetical protein
MIKVKHFPVSVGTMTKIRRGNGALAARGRQTLVLSPEDDSRRITIKAKEDNLHCMTVATKRKMAVW